MTCMLTYSIRKPPGTTFTIYIESIFISCKKLHISIASQNHQIQSKAIPSTHSAKMTLYIPHILGTTHHKPIDPNSPTQEPKEPSQKLADETAKLQQKATQPHINYENAAQEHQAEEHRKHSVSESTHHAAVLAARSVGKQRLC